MPLGPKNDDNTQFARVGFPGGISPIGAQPFDNGAAPLCDDQQRLLVSVIAGTPTNPGSFNTSPPNLNEYLLHNGAGQKLYSVYCSHNAGQLLWLQFFDAIVPPAPGTPSMITDIPIPDNGLGSAAYPEGISFPAFGVLAVLSTTAHVLTISVANAGMFSGLISL